MCAWGETEKVTVTIPADLSHHGQSYKRRMEIDKCIAPIVRALENEGIFMRGSCCGHGNGEGSIELQDGRRLVLQGEVD